MTLSKQRRFVTPGRDETLEEVAARALPDEMLEAARDQIRSWNLQAADIEIFDPDSIARDDEEPAFDMPGEGMRYVRAARGIDTVLVNGEIAYAKGAYTDARSGVICA